MTLLTSRHHDIDRRWPTARAWGVLACVLPLAAGCKAKSANEAPVADAGEDQVRYVTRTQAADGSWEDTYEEVTLDGSASFDPDGGLVSHYFWSFDSTPIGSELTHGALEPNADISPITRFTPDREGSYGVTLQVFDGQMVSVVDYVWIEVLRQNGAPVADAGEDLNGLVGESIAFDGSSSADPDGDFLSYHWEIRVVPPGSLLTTADLVYLSTPYPRLVPDVSGAYALSLQVSDGIIYSESDFVTVTVEDDNRSPVSLPGASRTVTPCHDNPITLDGSASYDPEGDPFTYLWSVDEVPYGSQVGDGTLTRPDSASTQATLDQFGLYVFMLTLDDGQSYPSTGTVAILYDNGSTQEPPVANAGGNQTVRSESECTDAGCEPCLPVTTLDGTDSYDPNDDPLTFFWDITSGAAELSDSFNETPELLPNALVPSASGVTVSTTVRIDLVVADCYEESEISTANITFTCEGVSAGG